MKEENEKLRKLLWLRHGCPFSALYGDDGEMQCHVCELDFKRDSIEKIEQRFYDMGLEKYKKSLKDKGR